MTGNNSQKPTIGESREIDTLAVRLFQELLPPRWLPRRQEPDYFVDFVVEIEISGEPSGIQFGVQVKGMRPRNTAKPRLRRKVDTKALTYYVDCVRYPVFVVLVDVENRKAYWLFAQRYLTAPKIRQSLRKQKTLTLPFGLDQEWSNLPAMEIIFRDAEKFVRDLHPGTVRAAVEQRAAGLHALDKRFDVAVSYVEGKERIQLSAKEPCPITISGGNPEFLAQMRALFEHGRDVHVKTSHLEVIGSPIFAEVGRNANLWELSCIPDKRKGHVEITIGHGATSKFLRIEGGWRAGSKTVTFEGGAIDVPLEIEAIYPRGPTDAAPDLRVTLKMRWARWSARPVLNLPSFDEIRELLVQLTTPDGVHCSCYVDGTKAIGGKIQIQEGEFTAWVVKTLDFLLRARTLARFFQVNPLLPDIACISAKQWEDVCQLYVLLTHGQMMVDISGEGLITFGSASEPIPPEWRETGNSSSLRIEPHEYSSNLFGVPLALPDVSYEMHGVEVKVSGDEGTPRTIIYTAKDGAVGNVRWLGFSPGKT